jgi:hypothetical protein
MQVINGNLEVKRGIYFGRQNYIIYDKKLEKYLFTINGGDIIFQIGTTGIETSGDLQVDGIFVTDDIQTNSLIVGTTSIIPSLISTDISTTSLTVQELNLSGSLAGNFDIIANSIEITSESLYHGDVTIEGGLNVLGAITAAESVSAGTTNPLFLLADGNPSDLLDIGLYGEYNNGITNVYSGLFRDASTVSNVWKLFEGVTIPPEPNFGQIDNYANLIVGNLTAQNGIISAAGVTVSTSIESNTIDTSSLNVTGTGTINNLINTTGSITTLTSTNSSITTLDSTLITSNDIGTTILGVTGTGTINDLVNTTLLSTLIQSTEIGVTNLGITNTLTVSGDTTMINLDATNISLIGDLLVGDNIQANSINVTTDVTIEGDLTVNTNTTIIGDLTVDGNTLYVESTENQIGIGTTDPSYTLDVDGDINLTGVLYQNGVTLDAFLWNLDDISGTNAHNTNTGNIGIGLTNPSYKLDVVGDINATGVYRLDGIEVLNNTAIGSGVVNSSLRNLGTQNTTLNMGSNEITNVTTLTATDVYATNITGILQTVSQPNIINLGNLTGLTVTGLSQLNNLNITTDATITGKITTETLDVQSTALISSLGITNDIIINGTLDSTLITSNEIGVTNLGVTGSAIINDLTSTIGSITTLYSTLITSNEIGVTNLGVTGSAIINDLTSTIGSITTLNSTLITSNEIGVTNLGVTGSAIINDLTSTIGSITTLDSTLITSNEIGVTNLGVTGSAIINDLTSTIGSITTLDSTLITSNEIGVTNLGVTGNSIISGNLTVDNNVGIGTDIPSFKLDVSGGINTATALYIDGIDIETVFNIIQVENKKTYFNQFLTLNNSNEITGNYGGVTEFIYTNNSSTQTLFISNLVVSIQDESPFNLSEYGSIGSALTNGINVFYTTDSGATKNFIVGTTFNVKSNGDWNNFTNDIKLTDLGTGDSILTLTLNFRNNGAYIILPQNERFGIEVQDDFSLVNSHKAQINGFLYANSEL